MPELIEELRAIAAAGFGEVEIAFSPEFWADDAQQEALQAVLEEAARLGVGVAMTLGAVWPLQTPNTARGSRHAAQELQYGVAWVSGGKRVTTPVPSPFDDLDLERPSTLVAVVAARVLSRGTGPRVVSSGSPWGKPTKIIEPERSTLLDQGTLMVLTEAVRGEGPSAVLSWVPGEGEWALTAFWSRDSEQGVTSFLDADAARAALGYLDEHQIGCASAALEGPESTATELFEDSLELNADCLFWSPTMLERFKQHNGYDPTPYLPLMMAHGQCRYWVPETPPRPDFAPVTTGGEPTDLGLRVRADFDRLLTDLYTSDHLALIQDWAVSHGLRHKAQAAYGQNLEPVRSFRELVRCGGRAEVESLNSGDRAPVRADHPNWRFSVDWQRSCVGGAHQGGAVRVSTELGAQMDKCLDFCLSDYRQMLDKEWAVGVTKPFVHGFASQAPGTAWPTQGRFGTIVSESWNHRAFPQWDLWRALTDYWARGTTVLETGTPRADVAVYRDGFLTTAARGNASADATAPERLIDAEPMERAGYCVQLLDPVGLAEDNVLGSDETGATVLFPHGPAYRALVLHSESVTLGAAQALAVAAQAGLAIVVVGEPPSRDSGWGGRDRSAQVAELVTQALAAPRSVRVGSWEDVPTALSGLGVRPRAGWSGPALLSQVRDAQEGRYVLLYNPSHLLDAEVTLVVEGQGAAEVLDLESGRILPVTASGSDGFTTVHLVLEERGIVFLRIVADVVGTSRPADWVRVAGALVGVGHACDPGADNEVALRWGNLVVVTEEPTGSREIVLKDQGPADWRDLPLLATTSGAGLYAAVLTTADGGVPEAEQLKGAVLMLGSVGGAAVVRAGGRDLAVVLRPDARVEVGTALAQEVSAGREAAIEIEVRTTLRNAALEAGIYTQGPWVVEHPSTASGLLGTVRVLFQR